VSIVPQDFLNESPRRRDIEHAFIIPVMKSDRSISLSTLESHYFQEPDGLHFPAFIKFPE
jgi:hypothetical protein